MGYQLPTNPDSINIAGHTVLLGGSQNLAASDLTNGTTGSGSVVLAGSPTITGTLSAAALNLGALGNPLLEKGGTTANANIGTLYELVSGDAASFWNWSSPTSVFTAISSQFASATGSPVAARDPAGTIAALPRATLGVIATNTGSIADVLAAQFVGLTTATDTFIYGLNIITQEKDVSTGIVASHTGLEIDIQPFFQSTTTNSAGLIINLIPQGGTMGTYANSAAIIIGGVPANFWSNGIQLTNISGNGILPTPGTSMSALLYAAGATFSNAAIVIGNDNSNGQTISFLDTGGSHPCELFMSTNNSLFVYNNADEEVALTVNGSDTDDYAFIRVQNVTVGLPVDYGVANTGFGLILVREFVASGSVAMQMYYSNMGVLAQWDTSLNFYTNSSSFMLRSLATISGGGTTNVPTLTAGPVNGNPTKWLPYDDNGTTRYIPAW